MSGIVLKRKKVEGVSVIVPVYNSEKYLNKCLESILKQAYPKLEIICIDDGSTDQSGSICDRYASMDPRVKVLHCENGGASKARNLGVKEATYDIVSFVDSDDVIDCQMYEEMVGFMQEHSLDCVCCNCCVINYEGKKKSLKTPFENREILCEEKIMEYIIKPMLGFSTRSTYGLCSVCNKLFKRSIIEDNHIIFNEARFHGEDWQFCIEYYRGIKSVGFMNEEFYSYIHYTSASLSTKYRPNYFNIAVWDRCYFKKLFPMLEWDSPYKVKEMWELPVKSTIYYRQYIKGINLNNKLLEMYEMLKNNYLDIPENLSGTQKRLKCALDEDDQERFIRILKLASLYGFFGRNLRHKIKQIIQKQKKERKEEY